LVVKVYRGAEPKNHLYYYNLSNGGVNSSIPLTTIVDKFEASYDVTAMVSFLFFNDVISGHQQ